MVGLQPVVIGVGAYDSLVAHRNWVESPPRVLNTFEVAIFTEDGGTAYMNGRECAIKKDWVLLGRPGDVRWNKLHFRCWTVHFSTDEPVLLQMLDTIPQFFRLDDSERIVTMFRGVWEVFRSEERFSVVSAAARLCELLWQLHLSSADDNVFGGRNPIRKAVRLIQEKYNERITVEQMAKLCGLSTSHFHKMFVETMGTTPNRYLILTRLSAAKALLLAGNQSVAQVAECCGFSSQAYFCQCLKKATGMSPKRFCRMANRLDEA